MFQPNFDTSAEDQLAWDEFGYGDFLATMDGAPQQADEVSASQLTQPPPVLTQPSQLAAGGATPDAAGSSQAAKATPSPDQLVLRVVSAPEPWTYDRKHTWAGARAIRGERGRRI
jgi:hypothetical protein